MSVKVEKIDTRELRVGMYVSQLDRPWIETPFPLQGFHIRSEDEVAKLRIFCKYVYIDLKLGVGPVETEHAAAPRKAPSKAGARGPVRGAVGKFTPVRYQVTQPLKREVAQATAHHRDLTRAMVHMMGQLREGRSLNPVLARKAATVVVQSVLRNPDAMIWLARLKDKDSYSYNHGVRSSILAAVFGRHLGLPQDVLENLTAGAMLMDVGNVRVPRSLLTTCERDMDAEDRKALRAHVQHGVDILEEAGNYHDQVIGVVQFHHERYDGSGYPFGLSGTAIPLLARIASIVDTYDAVTSPRPWADPVSPTEAVSMLYEQRDAKFQGSLVEQFIQSIGVYPTGTLVELSNGEVGVVIAQNPNRRLRPKVMVVTDAGKNALAQPKVVDLMAVHQDEAGGNLSVKSSLMPGAFGVDPGKLQVNAA